MFKHGKVLVSLGFFLLLGACSPAPDRLGVSSRETGEVSIHYMRCVQREEQVDRIELVARQGLADADEVLWEVRRSETFTFPEGDALAEEFQLVPGAVPEGFEEVVEFQRQIKGTESLRVVVETSMETTTLGFRLQELQPGKILQANEQGLDAPVSPENFREDPNGCEPPSGILTGFRTLVAIVVGLGVVAAVTLVLALVRSGNGEGDVEAMTLVHIWST